MAIGIYKSGQGYWTRLMTAIALGLLVFLGGLWVSDIVANVRLFGMEPVYTQALAFIIIAVVFGLLGYYYIALKPSVVDFMIATEGEMKKVNWSSRKEIAGHTYIVIAMTVFIAILCFLFDLAFQWLSIQAGVLEYFD